MGAGADAGADAGGCFTCSKLGFWFVAPVCPGRVLAEKWKPSLAEVLSLGSSFFGTSRGSGELELQLSKRAAGEVVRLLSLGSVKGGCSWLESKLSECAVTGDGGYQVF